MASWLPSSIIAGAAASALASSLVIWREAGEGARKGGAVQQRDNMQQPISISIADDDVQTATTVSNNCNQVHSSVMVTW